MPLSIIVAILVPQATPLVCLDLYISSLATHLVYGYPWTQAAHDCFHCADGSSAMVTLVGGDGPCEPETAAADAERAVVSSSSGVGIAISGCPVPSLDERSAARSSQAVEQHSQSAIRCSPSLTKPGCPGCPGFGGWPVQADSAVRILDCWCPVPAQKLRTGAYSTLC